MTLVSRQFFDLVFEGIYWNQTQREPLLTSLLKFPTQRNNSSIYIVIDEDPTYLNRLLTRVFYRRQERNYKWR